MSEEKEEREQAKVHAIIGTVPGANRRRPILVSVRSLPGAKPTIWCNRVKEPADDMADAKITKLGSVEPEEVEALIGLMKKAKDVALKARG